MSYRCSHLSLHIRAAIRYTINRHLTIITLFRRNEAPIILRIIGLILIIYGISIAVSVHSGSLFFLVWPCAGLLLCFLAGLIRSGLIRRIPDGFLYAGAGILLAAVLIYAVCLVQILSCFGRQADNKPEYLLVLGAQVNEDGPSRILKYRLDAAEACLKENPGLAAVLSGGQGRNEPWSEAEGMRRYLSDIEPDRLILEEESESTGENLRNCFSITGDVPVAVVTNDFHLYRAMKLAELAGYSDVSGIDAGSSPYYLLNNITREVPALLKDLLIKRR